jgi:hypothetical protein
MQFYMLSLLNSGQHLLRGTDPSIARVKSGNANTVVLDPIDPGVWVAEGRAVAIVGLFFSVLLSSLKAV